MDVANDGSGFIAVPDVTVPVAVEVNGIVYDLEHGFVQHDTENSTFIIETAPVRAAANLPVTQPEVWRVWMAGGKQGEAGGTFRIEVVSALPDSPDAETLYLIPEA